MPGELEIISQIRSRARPCGQVIVGIGDDAAVIKPGGACHLVTCCDLMVEEVHFRREWASAELIGRKALAVTLSDVAAMGAEAKFAMVAIALPSSLPSQFIQSLMGGMFELADQYGVSIIGGDTSSSRDWLFIDTIAIGQCLEGRAVTRRGAQAGDRVYVTGELGASALGLMLLERGFRLDDASKPQIDFENKLRQQAIRKHLAPNPRLAIGQALGERGIATAMIDISDGLSTDLTHILEESRCGAIIHAGHLPVAESVAQLSVSLAADPLNLALHSGEEYELLFTARPDSHEHVTRLSNEFGLLISMIGEIVEEPGLQLEQNNTTRRLAPSGYEHQI